MATKTIITKVDDIDGSPAAESFTFAWQGVKYNIDLSKAHAAEIKADFAKWVAVASRDRSTRAPRKPRAAAAEVKEVATAAPAPAKAARKPAKKATRRSRPAAKKNDGPSAADIRAWAAKKGIEVAGRGRLAPAIVEQFLADTAAAVAEVVAPAE